MKWTPITSIDQLPGYENVSDVERDYINPPFVLYGDDEFYLCTYASTYEVNGKIIKEYWINYDDGSYLISAEEIVDRFTQILFLNLSDI
jgi:hypothetical protein